jgi:hypothetical protein
VSRSGQGPKQRLKTAKGRKVSSTRWLERQLNDPYVKRAKAEGYRSRAAYKLLELDEKYGLLKGVKAVVDLGIAPGGWSQVVRRRSPQAAIAGIDLLPTDPIDGVAILQMDFMDEAAPVRLWPPTRSAILKPIICGRWLSWKREWSLRLRYCDPAAPMSPRCLPGAPTTAWSPR